VQIAEYVGERQQRIVKYIGSARTPAELGIVMARARQLLEEYEHPGQDAFDLGLDGVVDVDLLVDKSDRALFELPAPVAPSAVRATAAPGRVVATASGLLFDVLSKVYDDLGLDVLGDPVFRDLVVARVVEPTSLLDIGRVLTEMGRTPAPYITMRRTLARCATAGYRDKIADLSFAYAQASGDISLCLYDVTTLYFEAEKEDGLRKVGFSKERRVDPQIVVGLLVDRRGFPLEIACFEGNKGRETHAADSRRRVPGTARDREHGRRRGCRDALGEQPDQARRGRLPVHRRLTHLEGPDRSRVPLPLARGRVHRRTGSGR